MTEPLEGGDLLRPIRDLISHYVETNMPLEAAAARFAHLWREAATASSRGSAQFQSFERLRREATDLRALHQVQPEQARRIRELVDAGLARLAADEQGAA
jgi:hypothetical protein